MDTAPTSKKKNKFIVLIAWLALLLGLANAYWGVVLKNELTSLYADKATQEKAFVDLGVQFKQIETTAQMVLSQAAQDNAARFDQASIKEAESLIRLAEARIVLLQDKEIAIALLNLADQRLATVKTKAVQNARAAIAQDIQRIVGLQIPDEAALFNTLSTVQTRVEQFQFESAPVADIAPLQAATSAQTFAQQVMALISVKKHDVAVPRPLSKDSAALLKQSVLTDLEAAKEAVLRQNDAFFHDALARAQHTLALAPLKQSTLDPIIKIIDTLNAVSLRHATIEFQSISAITSGEKS